MVRPGAVRDTYNRIAARYDAHAALEQEVGRRLLERCAHARRQPDCILDLGCGTGTASVALKKMFRRARVVGIDSAAGMLGAVRDRASLMRPISAVCADLEALPIASASADLVFSNLAVHWCVDPKPVFGEFRRVLAPGGMLLFSALGPATLRELREASAGVAGSRRFPVFPDLMEVGDGLVASGFSEPVMDMETITVRYRSLEALTLELDSTGMSLLVPDWIQLTRQPGALVSALTLPAGGSGIALTYEIIYGTAFGPGEGQPIRTAGGETATFSVKSLLKSRRMR